MSEAGRSEQFSLGLVCLGEGGLPGCDLSLVDVEGPYLGEASCLRELGAHMSLIHANQGSVQFLSRLQVSFQQRTLAKCVAVSSEAEPTRYLALPDPFLPIHYSPSNLTLMMPRVTYIS